MGFRFRRRVKLAPGVYLNIGRSSASVSVGPRGAHVTFGSKGTTTTVGVPGTGMSYSERVPRRAVPRPAAPVHQPSVAWGYFWLACLAGLAGCGLYLIARHLLAS